MVSNSAPANLAYHDPKTAPTLARIERLVGHPVDAEKLRAKLDAARAGVEVAPVQVLGAEAPSVPARETGAYYLVSVGAGPASYDHRSELKALHLRWDPAAREWSGIVLGEDIATLEGLGLAVEVRQRRQPREPKGSAPAPKRDHAKASVEAYGARSVQGRESVRFSLLDVTAGLPDDSREDDQRVRAQAQRERQGRVRVARAVIQAHPGLETVLARDQTKLTLFCAVHHVTPDELCPHAEGNTAPIRAAGTPRDGMCSYCHGWHAWARPVDVADVEEVLSTPADWMSEVRAREAAALPGSDEW